MNRTTPETARRAACIGLALGALALGACAGSSPGRGDTSAAGVGNAISSAGAAPSGGASATPLPPGTPANGQVDADDPHLRYYGRWSSSDPKRPVASWGPVAVELRFEGPSVRLKLVDEQANLGDEGTGNVYQFSVDGGDFQLLTASAATEYDLVSGLPDGEHELLLVRRTESKWGTTTFAGFELAAGKRVLDPGPRAAHSLEVFGDSISAGLANENTGYYTNQTENGYLAFGPVLARKLGAEWRVEARGGGSFYNDFYLPMLPFFDRTLGPANSQNAPSAQNPQWSFALFQPDVFILALGTNDFSDMYPHIDQTAYVSKYSAFLRKLRGYYPNAALFCLAPFKSGAPWDEARQYITLAVGSLGDARVFAIDPVGTGSDPWLTDGDYVTGDAYHPNVQGHEKIAVRLEAIVKAKLGW